MPFSHVSETILQSRPNEFSCGPLSVDDFLIDAQDLLQSDKLAELLSVAIVLTERFKAFYSGHVAPDAQPNDTLRIASLILGRATEPEFEGIAKLISGDAIDADKIDYINRDAASCGIAVGVDVSRLFLRSRFLMVSRSELRRLRELDEDPPQEQVIFVVNASGIDSIEEIGQARTMLYHRVYLHQTTRNAERLLGKALEENLVEGGDLDPSFTDALTLWTHDDFEMLKRMSARSGHAATLASRLRSRRLPKRACAFGRRFVKMGAPIKSIFPSMGAKDSSMLVKQVIGTALEEFRSPRLTGKTLSGLESAIAAEAVVLADRLRAGGYSAPEDGPPLVSVLPMTNIEENREDCFILENEQLMLTPASSVSDEQMDAADIMKAAGYILTDPAWRTAVFLAARTVFYDHLPRQRSVALLPHAGAAHEVTFSSRIVLDAKIIAQRVRIAGDDLDNAIREAAQVGYFDRSPRLAPVDIDPALMFSAARRLRDFTGQGNWRVDETTVEAFISQFPISLRAEAVELVDSFKVFNKVELATAVGAGIRGIDLRGGRGYIAALSPDSGNVVRTTLEHELTTNLAPLGWAFKKTVRDVFREAQPEDHLVLVDDNVTSGSQAICQFLAWLGIPETEWTADQLREKGIERAPLDPRDIELLKKINLAVVVDSGTTRADENVTAMLAALGVERFQGIVFHQALSLSSASLSPGMEDFLRAVGTSTLAWCRHRMVDLTKLTPDQLEECSRNALGYDGVKALIATQLNVPAGTLTPFWAPGFFNGEPWLPLLLRRGYIGDLVLS